MALTPIKGTTSILDFKLLEQVFETRMTDAGEQICFHPDGLGLFLEEVNKVVAMAETVMEMILTRRGIENDGSTLPHTEWLDHAKFEAFKSQIHRFRMGLNPLYDEWYGNPEKDKANTAAA